MVQSWISDPNDFSSLFYQQVTPMLPTKFGVSWPFYSGEEVKNRFLRWQPSWISHRNNFSYVLSTSHPEASYQVSSQLAFQFRRRSETTDFKHGGHLGLLIGTILAIFDVQVTPMLPTKFQVEWPFRAKYRFSRWQPTWISKSEQF